MTKFFDKIPIPEEAKNFVDKSHEIGDEILSILQKQGKTQKDLAELLGKKEPEISKWLSGTHNFTLKTITKIETVLGADIVTSVKVPKSEYYPFLKGKGSFKSDFKNKREDLSRVIYLNPEYKETSKVKEPLAS